MNNDIILVALVKNHHSFYSQIVGLLANLDKHVTILTIDSNRNLLSGVDNRLFQMKYVKGDTADILFQNLSLINEHKLLIIDELYDGLSKAWRLRFNNQTKISFIHNANKWFYFKSSKSLKTRLKNYIKKRYINQFDSFIVMGPNIADYIESIGVNSPCFILPFDQGFVEDNSHGEESLVITIPGMIAQNRRDYLGFLKALEHYYSTHANSRIQVRLLGRIAGERQEEVRSAIDDINRRFGLKITYWTKFISEEEFQLRLSQSHLILSNLKVVVLTIESIEIYGITKETGIAYAIAKYAKPAIVPYMHQVLFGLDSQLLRYMDYNSLMEQFECLESGQINLPKLRAKASENRIIVNERLNRLKAELLTYIRDRV